MKLALFQSTTKTADFHKPTMNQLPAEPELMDARPFKFELRPDFTSDKLLVKGNATILSNGVVTAGIDTIINLTTRRWVDYPYTQELRDAVEDACASYFEDAAFAKFFVANTKVYF